MDDKQVAEEQVVETETTQTSSPAVESPITGDETIQGETVQTPVVEEADVPAVTEEQRRAFQDMRLENKRLKEEIAAKQSGESAFNVFRAQTPPAPSIPVQVQNFTDPITGETDWQSYNAAQQQREQQILAQARFQANQAVEERLDEEKARSKYPDLFSDPDTEKLIVSRALYEMAQGNKPSISQIAGEFARNFKQAVSKAEKVGAERVLNEVSEKEKAGLTAQSQAGQGQRIASQEDLQQLSHATRTGNADAITARVSKIPWANK